MLESIFFIKKRLQHRYFPIKFAKSLRAPFSKEQLRWLPLHVDYKVKLWLFHFFYFKDAPVRLPKRISNATESKERILFPNLWGVRQVVMTFTQMTHQPVLGKNILFSLSFLLTLFCVTSTISGVLITFSCISNIFKFLFRPVLLCLTNTYSLTEITSSYKK